MSDYNALITTLFEKLNAKGWMVSAAESCTGGMISAAITETAGSSAYFDRGFITYSNKAKMEMLNVSANTLKNHGAVSAHTAEEMALGALKNSNAQISVSITGIAGPDGGTTEKPVGLVYIGIATAQGVQPHQCNFKGSRTEIRKQTVEQALSLLIEIL